MTCPDFNMELAYLVNDEAETAAAFPRRASDPDAALVEQLRRRDARATETLVSTYGDRVYRLAIRITGTASDAEEVVQDALWAVTRKIDTFRGEAAFGSWVYRITANAVYQKLRGRRSRARELSWESLSPPFGQDGPHVEPAVDWSPRLEDPALQSELHSILSSAIDELPTNYRGGPGLARCRRAFQLRDRRDTPCDSQHGQIARASSPTLSAQTAHRLHERESSGSSSVGRRSDDRTCASLCKTLDATDAGDPPS